MANEIVLERLSYAKITVNREDLTKHMSEIWNDEELSVLSERCEIPLEGLKNMTVIAYIKADIASKRDRMGYAKYREVLKKEGFDV